MPTLAELEALKTQVESMNTDESTVLADLLRSEIKRRKNAGRPTSLLSRKEQNRLAQHRFREKKKGLTDKRK